MEQRSLDWFKIRCKRFTGSEMWKLLQGGRRDMTEDELKAEKERGGKRTTITTEFGDTALEYIFSRAVNIVFGFDEEESQFDTIDIRRGNELEPFAFNKFKELKELEFIEVEKCDFFPYGSDAGASPDGLVKPDKVLEIKCPRPNKFFKLVKDGHKAIDKEYMVQMQTEIMCTNSVGCHFFNYIIRNGEEMWHEIYVERDDVMIALIKEKIKKACLIRDEYINELRKNKQF